MLLEMIVAGGLAYYAARRFVMVEVKLRPNAIAETVEKTRKSLAKASDQVRRHMVSKAEWEESRAVEKAQAMYDRTVVEFFQNATEDEKEMLLRLFRKYMPSDK